VATILVNGTYLSVCLKRAIDWCGADQWPNACHYDGVRTIALCLLFCAGIVAGDTLPSAYLDSPKVREGEYVLWHDPGAVESLDFRYGIGGEANAPKPPFTFVDEDPSGSTPKIKVKDANHMTWVIKFGEEASPDTFCTRLAWALGYYVEPTYFVSDGVIEGVRGIERARKQVDAQGHFQGGRFQLRSKDPKFLKTVDWSWSDNPFLNTPELNGLKIVMMLLSDWDNKDARDAEKRGTNTAIYQHENLLYYFIDDWGGAMGRWGKYFTRSKWRADTFLKQSPDFVTAKGADLKWGYVGQHSDLLKDGPKLTDIRWLMQYLGRVTDNQLRTGLLSSGASETEAETYRKALRIRIAQLQKLAQE
jgi:hypothetical protein